MPEQLNDKKFALAALSVSNMRALPDHTTELVSQVLMGMPLEVFEYKDKFYRVHTPEGYNGWIDLAGLQLLTQQEMEAWRNASRAIFCNIFGYVHAAPVERGEVVSDVVLGDLFEVVSREGEFLQVRLPDGRKGYVRESSCAAFHDWARTEPGADAILSFARQMMGFPYLWGGASSKGVDCSGFTKLMFYTQGIILAGDASQQVKYGQPIDISRLENLETGDLLFFGNSAERPGHVGIHLGNGDFIHSSGKVHISSIIPGDPKHDPNRNFVAARRIVTSKVSEGISVVKMHPWYCPSLPRRHGGKVPCLRGIYIISPINFSQEDTPQSVLHL